MGSRVSGSCVTLSTDGTTKIAMFYRTPDEEKKTSTTSTPTSKSPEPVCVPFSNQHQLWPRARVSSTPRVRQEPPPPKNVCGMSKTKFLATIRGVRMALKKMLRKYLANRQLRVAKHLIRTQLLRHLLKIAFRKRRDAATTAALVMPEDEDPRLSPVPPEAASKTDEDASSFKAKEDDSISNEMQLDYKKLHLHECDTQKRMADSKLLHERFMKTINAKKNRHLPTVSAIGDFASSSASDDETADAALASSKVVDSHTKPRKKKKK